MKYDLGQAWTHWIHTLRFHLNVLTCEDMMYGCIHVIYIYTYMNDISWYTVYLIISGSMHAPRLSSSSITQAQANQKVDQEMQESLSRICGGRRNMAKLQPGHGA